MTPDRHKLWRRVLRSNFIWGRAPR